MNYASFYECFVFKNLGEMFEISEDLVKSIVSKMIYDESLSASIDFDQNKVLLNKSVHGSKVDLLAAQYAEKISILVDANEKLLDSVKPQGEKLNSRKR